MRKILLFIVFLFMVSCSKTNEQIITSHQWKHGGGYPVAGDWLDFSRKGVSFSNDTIYANRKPLAVVESIATYYGEYRLHLKSLSGNENGMYVEKGETK